MKSLALAFITEPQPLPELPVAPDPVKVQVGWRHRAQGRLKSVYIGKIVDWQKVLQYFSGHQQILDLLQRLVDADVRLNKSSAAFRASKSTRKGSRPDVKPRFVAVWHWSRGLLSARHSNRF